MDDVTLFVGPSGYGAPPASLAQGNVALRPPVRRGDIDQLLATAPRPGVVVICDGVFQVEPAVSHAEIGRALDIGWQVWGVSSIGAIRAFEMRSYGMQGFGYVHSLFHRFDDFTDDEMCLLHFPEPPWFPVSEALVNLRYAFERQGRTLGISQDSERRVLAALMTLWFGDRTQARMRAVMQQHGGIEAPVADALLAWLKQHRVKTIDLIDLMAARPWQAQPAPAARSPARRPPASPTPPA
jgi:hypothetical protein